MFSKKFASIFMLSLFVVTLLAGCDSKQESKSLVLKKYGPADIKVGQIFNKQLSGESAIYTDTENATPTTILVLNGVPLESAVEKEGTVVTAVVPKKLYEKAGEYPLYLLDKKNQNKSNEITFSVKP
jgi:hypothetical protein